MRDFQKITKLTYEVSCKLTYEVWEGVIIFFILWAGYASAGQDALDRCDDLYDRERFTAADSDADGLLDKDELRHAGADFEYYLSKASFIKTDTSRDGLISLDELRAMRQEEKSDSQARDREIFYALKLDLGEVDAKKNLRDVRWLKWNLGLARDLFMNNAWLMEHPDIVLELISDKEWMNRYPLTAQALYENRRFLTLRPDIAAKLYENQELLDRYPKLGQRVYRYRDWMDKNK